MGCICIRCCCIPSLFILTPPIKEQKKNKKTRTVPFTPSKFYRLSIYILLQSLTMKNMRQQVRKETAPSSFLGLLSVFSQEILHLKLNSDVVSSKKRKTVEQSITVQNTVEYYHRCVCVKMCGDCAA